MNREGDGSGVKATYGTLLQNKLDLEDTALCQSVSGCWLLWASCWSLNLFWLIVTQNRMSTQHLSGNKLIQDVVLFLGYDQSTDAEDSDSNTAQTIWIMLFRFSNIPSRNWTDLIPGNLLPETSKGKWEWLRRRARTDNCWQRALAWAR